MQIHSLSKRFRRSSLFISFLYLLSIALFAVTCLAQPSTNPAANYVRGECLVGSLPEESYVTRLGGQHYSIALEVPPGGGGLEPELSIDYDQYLSDDKLGPHFKLGGTSVITRCAAIPDIHGTDGGVNYDEDDRFCLDGQPLVVTSGQYGGSGSQYRTAPETFSKIRSYSGSTQQGPWYFEVYRKDGLIYEYGGNSTSDEGRIYASGQTSIVKLWALSRIRNRSGAYIDYKYIKDPGELDYRLTYIDYTGYLGGSFGPARAPTNRIYLGYSTRPQIMYYEAGYAYTNQWRLSSIQNFKQPLGPSPVPINIYHLKYENQNTTLNHSPRIIEVKKCRGFSTQACLSPTKFKYSDAENSTGGLVYAGTWGGNFGGAFPTTTEPILDQMTKIYGAFGLNLSFFQMFFSSSYLISQEKSGDFNGDGKADIVGINSVGVAKVSISAQSDFLSPIIWANGLEAPDRVRVADINGDGRSDLVVHRSNNSINVYFSDGQQSFNQSLGHTISNAGALEDLSLADVNGDGRTDVLMFKNSRIDVWLSNANGQNFAPVTTWSNNFSSSSIPYLGDLNGDGRADIVQASAGALIRVWYSTPSNNFIAPNASFDTGLSYNIFTFGLLPIQFGDFNGDGLNDVMAFGSSETKIFISTGKDLIEDPFFSLDSSYTTTVGGSLITRIGDFNGDGKDDIYNYQEVATYTYLPQIRLSTGRQFSTPIGLGSTLLNSGVQFLPAWIADLDGDGRSDIAQQDIPGNSTDIFVFLSQAIPYPDLVTEITNGYGKKSSITHFPMTSPAAYLQDSTTNYIGNDIRKFRHPYYLVGEVVEPDGIGGNSITQYTYSGALFNHNYGFLGFESSIRIDYTKKHHQKIDYLMTYPQIGNVSKVQNSRFINHTNLSPQSSITNSWKNEVSDANISYARIEVLDQREYNTNAALIKRIVTSKPSVDLFGNEPLVSSWYSLDNSFVTTNITFNNRVTEWLLGRSEIVTISGNRQGGQGAVTRTFETNFPNDNNLPNWIRETWSNSPTPGTTTRRADLLYDAYANQTQVTLSASGETNRVYVTHYDPDGIRPIDDVNPLGQIQRYEYSLTNGNLNKFTDYNNLATSWTYDGFSRLTRETRPDGNKTSISHCPALFAPIGSQNPPIKYSNLITIQKDGESPVTQYFDVLDRPIRISQRGFNDQYIFTDIKYKSDGLVEKISQPYFNTDPIYWNSFEYDLFDRITKRKLPNLKEYVISYTSNHNMISNVVTSGQTAVLQKSVTDPLGRKIVTFYDSFDQPIQIQDIGTQALVNSAQSYLRNGFGYPIKSIGLASDTLINITYDPIGRKREIIDPDTHSTLFTYTPFDELLSVRNANGQQINFTYDRLSRIKTRNIPDGISTWTYDTAANGVGKLHSIQNSYLPNFSKIYGYDTLGRHVSTTSALSGGTYVTGYSYDSFSRLKDLTYPGTSPLVVRHEYTANGFLKRLLLDGGMFLFPFWTAQALDASGRVVSERYGDNGISNYAYDPASQALVANQNLDQSNVLINDLNYQHDDLARTDFRRDGSASGAPYEDLTYNSPLKKLSNFQKCSGANCNPLNTVMYDYAYGNITSKTGIGSYFYSTSGDGPHAVSHTSTSLSFDYDLTGRASTFRGLQIDWWTFGMPRSIINPLQSLVYNFSYEPDGHKFHEFRTKNNSLFETVYIDDIYEFNKSYATNEIKQTSYVYAYGKPVMMFHDSSLSGPKTRYLRMDYLGSLITATDDNGLVTDRYSYDPFGLPRNGTDWNDNSGVHGGITRRGFGWHEHFDELGLIHMGARFYDPKLARFLSADPTVPDDQNPLAFNRYTYVYNEPMNYTDATGYQPKPVHSPPAYMRHLPIQLQADGALGKFFEANLQKQIEFNRNFKRPLATGALTLDNTPFLVLFPVLDEAASFAGSLHNVVKGDGDVFDLINLGKITKARVVGQPINKIANGKDLRDAAVDIVKDAAKDIVKDKAKKLLNQQHQQQASTMNPLNGTFIGAPGSFPTHNAPSAVPYIPNADGGFDYYQEGEF